MLVPRTKPPTPFAGEPLRGMLEKKSATDGIYVDTGFSEVWPFECDQGSYSPLFHSRVLCFAETRSKTACRRGEF
jgi:hypothetical protein